MPRIRTVKPEFWQDEKLGPLDPIHRLVFLGLISQADDAGRLVDSPRMLNGMLFPYTEDCCGDSLEVLARLGRVLRYTSNSGQRLLQIVNWGQHQRVDNPSRYVLPPPPPKTQEPQTVTEPSREPSESVATDKRDPSVPILDLGPTTNDHIPPFENEFSTFWERYPLKVGRKAALKAYQARRREGVFPDIILQGLGRYLAFKAAVQERHHNPATFLGPNEWYAEPWHIPEAATVKEPGTRDEQPKLDPKFSRAYVPDMQPRKAFKGDGEQKGNIGGDVDTIMGDAS